MPGAGLPEGRLPATNAKLMTLKPKASGGSWSSPHGTPLPIPGARTLVMGVLNVTPDSFSDAGELASIGAVLDRAGAMLAQGADVLDVGGESTRPGAAPVEAQEEKDRVLPALAALRKAFPRAALSVDTSKAQVAAAAVMAGADLVNDVSGLCRDLDPLERARWINAVKIGETAPVPPASALASEVARLQCPVILMHNRPDRSYGDFWEDVRLDLKLSLALARHSGIPDRQIWLDPGFGFAKDVRHNLEVLRNLRKIVEFGYPVLLGTSRKSTIGRITQTDVKERAMGTAATVVWGIGEGCAMVRIHDVGEIKAALRMADAIKQGLQWSEPDAP
jgi:dihydropteroate synthase